MNESISLHETSFNALAFMENPLDGLSSEDRGMKVHRLVAWEEILGQLLRIEQPQDGYFVAQIGKLFVMLPEEMIVRLQGLQGRKIGILRTDADYRFRVITKRP